MTRGARGTKAVWQCALLLAAAVTGAGAFRTKPVGVGDTPQVRTVLFHKSDLSKPCWSRAEVGLLFDRYMMQALLPRNPPTDTRVFLEYAVLCLQTVDEEIGSGKGKETVVEALADAFGGYLQAFVLPAAKRAYYEGTVAFDTCSRLYALQNDLKSMLKTNGGDWVGPVEPKGRRKTEPLRLRPVKNGCDQIIFSTGAKQADNGPGKGRLCKNTTRPADPALQIPIPFFDDCKKPNAIAVPLRNCSLLSLSIEPSKNVLVTYYETSIGCIEQVCRKDRKYDCARKKNDFNKRYYAFLKKYVAPRLLDTTWYPAFYRAIPLMSAVKRTAPANAGPCSNASHSSHDESRLKHMFRHDKSFSLFMLSPLFILFWILLAVILLAIIFTCYKYGGSKDNSDAKNTQAAAISEDTTEEGHGKCYRCLCNSKAKASFTAKFYCRKTSLDCGGDDDENEATRHHDSQSLTSSQQVTNTYAEASVEEDMFR